MGVERSGTVRRSLVTAASASYAANCALGLGVASGRIRTGRAHWVHHALYVCTATLTAAAAVAAVSGTARDRRAGRALLPTALPLSAIPFVGTHTGRHPSVASAAAPFYLAALLRAWR